ncbi:MAG: hypothetical protein M1814_002276 [Vezdaea aestivalis]|nr:MAG: hypothetical protein M1814_002276 [Vezdaea aestivalis]
MASPPPPSSALSPPPFAPHQLPTSKKRPSSSAQGAGPHSKRRKPSIASAPTPLRQISVPDGIPTLSAPYRRAGSIASSSATAQTQGGRKRRGRASANVSVSGALVGKGEGSVISTRSEDGNRSGGKGSIRAGEGEEDEDDEEAEGEVRIQGSRAMDEVQEKEREKILIGHFTPEQANRWEAWRRVKPAPKTIKAIANRTLSQSIPARVAIALNGMTKSYAGGIIERARSVQNEWAAEALPGTDGTALGPLLPEHLREAVRRHKRSMEGGGAGARGLSSGSGFTLGHSAGVGGSVNGVASAGRRRGTLFH